MIMVIIGTAILGFILFLWFSKIKGTALLKVNISTNNGSEYFVFFDSKKVGSLDQINMVLCFAAKMLYLFNPKSESEVTIRDAMLKGIKKLGESDLKTIGNISFHCDQQIEVAENKNSNLSGKFIKATLYSKRKYCFYVQTSIPLPHFEYQYYHSFLALIQVTVSNLSDNSISILQDALKNMINSYFIKKINPADLDALTQVPNLAYLESTTNLPSETDDPSSFVMPRKKFSICAKCAKETSKTGNYTNMFLSGFSSPEEFDNVYGMMCTEHAQEVTNKIVREHNLTESDVVKAYKQARNLMNQELNELPRSRAAMNIASPTIQENKENDFIPLLSGMVFPLKSAIVEKVNLALKYIPDNNSQGRFMLLMMNICLAAILNKLKTASNYSPIFLNEFTKFSIAQWDRPSNVTLESSYELFNCLQSELGTLLINPNLEQISDAGVLLLSMACLDQSHFTSEATNACGLCAQICWEQASLETGNTLTIPRKGI